MLVALTPLVHAQFMHRMEVRITRGAEDHNGDPTADVARKGNSERLYLAPILHGVHFKYASRRNSLYIHIVKLFFCHVDVERVLRESKQSRLQYCKAGEGNLKN